MASSNNENTKTTNTAATANPDEPYDPVFPETDHVMHAAITTHHGDEFSGLGQTVYGGRTSTSHFFLAARWQSKDAHELVKASIDMSTDPTVLLLRKTPSVAPNSPFVFVQTVAPGVCFFPFSHPNKSKNQIVLPLRSWTKLWAFVGDDLVWTPFLKSFLNQAKAGQRGTHKVVLPNEMFMFNGVLRAQTKKLVDTLSSDLAVYLLVEYTYVNGDVKFFLTYEKNLRSDWLELPKDRVKQLVLFEGSKTMEAFFDDPNSPVLEVQNNPVLPEEAVENIPYPPDDEIENTHIISQISAAPPPPPPPASTPPPAPPPLPVFMSPLPNTPTTTPSKQTGSTGKNIHNLQKEMEQAYENEGEGDEEDEEDQEGQEEGQEEGGDFVDTPHSLAICTNPLLGNIVRECNIDETINPPNTTTIVNLTSNSPISVVVNCVSPEKSKNIRSFSHLHSPPIPPLPIESLAPPPPVIQKKPQQNLLQPIKPRQPYPKTPIAHVSPSRVGAGVSQVPGAKRPAVADRAGISKNKLSRTLQLF